MKRRDFIKTTLSGAAAGLMGCGRQPEGSIMTVTGPIKAGELGRTLPHEHVMVDFVGADKTGPHRWNVQEVFTTMLPYLEAIKKQGVTGFVDCTPMFLGRDVGLLKRLSEATGIHILTNTGQYKEPYLPAYAFEQSAEQLAEGWIREMREGIDGTGIKPGFIKIAIHKEQLQPIQQKIVRAACLTHNATGATIACHSGYGPGILEMLTIFEQEKTPPEALIMVHAQGEKDISLHETIAGEGVWIEYDNIGKWEPERHIELISRMMDAGFEEQLLLSMDRGWYRVGEPGGGKVNPYTCLFGEFVPIMEKAGFNRDSIDQLTVRNPARAFAI